MAACPTIRLIDLIGKKWTFVILQEIEHDGHSGFNNLLRTIGVITPKILSRRLQELESEDIVRKDVAGEKAKTTCYALTKKGVELKQILDNLRVWNTRYSGNKTDCPVRGCVNCELFRN